MATAEQIKALIRSHAEGDDMRFYVIAMQVAAQAARSGHDKLATELRELIDQAKLRAKAALDGPRAPTPVPLVHPRGELADLLPVAYPKTRLNDMALTDALRARLDRVVTEQRERERLRARGFAPLRKLLLVGPPGTGKTMTAAALAGELGLPLFSIPLDGLITRYMGETAAKLRGVFDAIQSTRGVYFFDEFDALGTERGRNNDVGEIHRVLNSLLQFLERDDSDSLVLGATNHVDLLDRALFRRFDAVLEYPLPSPEIATRVMQGRLALLDTSVIDWAAAAKDAEGLSHAEIAMACEHVAKNAILAQANSVGGADLVAALRERRSPQRGAGMTGALFTIGYEGRTQDEYLALLMGAGVTLLADVRRNPISRKKGFSKSTLAQGCAAVGIRYEHLPELGIASEKRKNLATQAAVDALFAEYEREWLPQQGPTLAKLRAWLDAGERVALTCFERAPGDCHRHSVAEALAVPATHL